MHRVRTTIDIAAPPERVWSILTDFAAHPQWNPFITAIWGELKTGGGCRSPPGRPAARA